MRRNLYILIFFFLFKLIEGQELYTVFIDKVTIVVDNETIFDSKDKKRIFLTLDTAHTLTIYQDKKYKLILPFGAQPKGFPRFIAVYPKFFINDTSAHLASICINCDSIEDCCDLVRHQPVIRNWLSGGVLEKKTFVEITCRIIDMAPEDTLNYKAFNREGKWLGVDNGNKFFVNYHNDKKHGEAKLTYPDGASFSCHFSNGIADTIAQFNFPTKKEKRKRRRAPGILSTNCEHTIGQ